MIHKVGILFIVSTWQKKLRCTEKHRWS